MSEKNYKIKINGEFYFVGERVVNKINKNEFIEFNGLYKYESDDTSLYKRFYYSPVSNENEIEVIGEVTVEEMTRHCEEAR